MSLTIEAFETTCRVRAPAGAMAEARELADSVDRIARERLAGEIAACLGPSLDSDNSVVRIRRITVHLPVKSRKAGLDALAREWALAFARALFEALAYPEGHPSVQVRRFASPAAWYAAYLEALAAGPAAPLWEFQEIGHGGAPGAREVLAQIATDEPGLLREVLAALEAKGKLEAVLSALDGFTLESLVRSESEHSGISGFDLTFELLETVARLLDTVGPVRRWRLRDHRQALRTWSLAGALTRAAAVTPRHILWTLQALSEIQTLWTIATLIGPAAAQAWCERRAAEFPQPVAALLRSIAASPDAVRPAAGSPLARLAAMAEALSPAPAPAISSLPEATIRFLDSDWMGLTLLTGTVLRLDWWHRLAISGELAAYGGERAFRYVLFGVGCAIAGKPLDAPAAPDAAAALFAGIIGEVDLLGFRSFLATAPPALLARIGAPQLDSWEDAFRAAGDLLLAELLAQIRGFRRSSPRFARDQLMHRPGTAWVDDTAILVSIAPNTWSPALRLAGIDRTVDAAPWLAPRRLEFRLEGL